MDGTRKIPSAGLGGATSWTWIAHIGNPLEICVSCPYWQYEALSASVADIGNFEEGRMSQRIPIRTGNDLGQAIVEARRSLDLSATEVAQRTGLSPQYLSKIESGRTTRVLEHQLRILRRLGARVIVEFPDDER